MEGRAVLPDRPSLETLVETEDLGIAIFHPGGLGITRELAKLTRVGAGTRALEVAAGTGETARLLADEYGASITALDTSPRMIAKLRDSLLRHSGVSIVAADAHHLPFRGDGFDVALAECALCQFDKPRSLQEMVRVVRRGGRVGIHDLCWTSDAPDSARTRLVELEGERPETTDGWVRLFEAAGLADVVAVDRSEVMRHWTSDVRKQMGPVRYLRAVLSIVRRWGVSGLLTVFESERMFGSRWLGYALVVGTKR